MIVAAAVIVFAGRREAVRDRVLVVAGLEPFLMDARDEEDLVVHRQAEQDREHITGRNASIGPVRSTPMSEANHPTGRRR